MAIINKYIHYSKKTIIIISIAIIVFSVVTMFPGFFPLRALEPIFIFSCENAMRGEFNKVEETEFVGRGGMPVRRGFAECGVKPARDASEVCYTYPDETMPDGVSNPLPSVSDDTCYACQYGSENVKYGGTVLGKRCRPYKYIWRWNYKFAL